MIETIIGVFSGFVIGLILSLIYVANLDSSDVPDNVKRKIWELRNGGMKEDSFPLCRPARDDE